LQWAEENPGEDEEYYEGEESAQDTKAEADVERPHNIPPEIDPEVSFSFHLLLSFPVGSDLRYYLTIITVSGAGLLRV
jgi:hypothetical protein